MKLKLLVFIFILFGYYCAESQSFRIKRTDVINDSADFVTATYNFGFEILLEGLPNSNSISFKLDYDNCEYVKFSQWKKGDYDVLQAVNIEHVDEYGDKTGKASLILGVSSGLKPQSNDNPTPKVIELEFVVLKNALNSQTLTMSFDRPVATTLDSNIGTWIPVNAQPLVYKIHSYVNVWPGDTDNSGTVDHLDFVPISQYIGMGSATKNFRSFKRQASSALWTPQRVLMWDSAVVTHADCDGNGDITTTDMLIVTYNLGRDTLNPYGSNEIDKVEISDKISKISSLSDYVVIPVEVFSDFNFTGVAGSIEMNNPELKLNGIENGELFDENNYIHYFQNNNYIHFVISNEKNSNSISNSGKLLNLIFEKSTSQPEIYIKELEGIDNLGNIFSLKSMSSINDLISGLIISNEENSIKIKCDEIINSTEITNIFGNSIKSNEHYSSHFDINISDLSSGVYFLTLKSNNTQFVKKFSVVR